MRPASSTAFLRRWSNAHTFATKTSGSIVGSRQSSAPASNARRMLDESRLSPPTTSNMGARERSESRLTSAQKATPSKSGDDSGATIMSGRLARADSRAPALSVASTRWRDSRASRCHHPGRPTIRMVGENDEELTPDRHSGYNSESGRLHDPRQVLAIFCATWLNTAFSKLLP